MKIMHLDDNRSERQRAYVETEDGQFRYRVLLDYAKGLPENMKYVPVMGTVAGGRCDNDDNLLVGLRGGSFMSPEPYPCLIKLDPEGNFIENLGVGVLRGMHFFNVTKENTIIMPVGNSLVEYSMDFKTVIKKYEGTKESNNTDPDLYKYVQMHRGIFATEPFIGEIVHHDSFVWMMKRQTMTFDGPFHNPTNAAQDSKGNYYVSDGYNNVAVHKFDKDMNLLASWGGHGVYDWYTDTPGKFLVVHSLAVDPNDNIWVCDREKDAVHVFDPDGNVIFYCSHNMGQPSGVDTDGKYIYVAGRGGFITIFTPDFEVVGQLGFYNGNLRAHDIAADSKGNLYLFPTHANYEHQIIALKRM